MKLNTYHMTMLARPKEASEEEPDVERIISIDLRARNEHLARRVALETVWGHEFMVRAFITVEQEA